MMAGKFEPMSVNDLIKGVVGSASRFKRNMKSIIEKYDREFEDDDLIDLYSMTIVKPGNGGHGVIRKSKPRIFGASKLKTTKRKEALLKSRLNSQPCEFNPDVSMAIARECKSVVKASRNMLQEPSDAETLSSHDDDEDENDCEDDLEESAGDVSSDEEGDDEEMSFGGKDFESLYDHSLAHLKKEENESHNENEGYVSGSDTKGQDLVGDETYDADEEDFMSSDVDLGKDRVSDLRFEQLKAQRLPKETIAYEKQFKGTGQREKSGGGNASFLLNDTNDEKKDASPDDSFVSISSSTNRHQSHKRSVLNLTSTISPSKMRKSRNDMFIISAESGGSSERRDRFRSDLEKPFVASKNITQTSTSLSSYGFDSVFKSPPRVAAKRVPESFMRKSSASTVVGSEKHMPKIVSSKAISHISEDSQKFPPSKEMVHLDSSWFQDVTNTSKSCIANHLSSSHADHDHTSKAIQVGSPIDINSLRCNPSSFEGSRKDRVKTNGMNFDDKLGLGVSVEFSSDNDEYEQDMLDINMILSDSTMKEKPENNSSLHSRKPSKTVLQTIVPQGQCGHSAHFSEDSINSDMAGRTANCRRVIKACHEGDRKRIYAPFIDKRSSTTLHQDTNTSVKHQSTAKRKVHALSPPRRGLQRQHSTSRTSGYQTDISSIPVSQELDVLAQNVTYSIVSGESTNECNKQLPFVPYENTKERKTDICNLTFQINTSPSKTVSYHTDISKLINSPQKPIKFNQEKLMMARKRYKPPEHMKPTSDFQHNGPTFSNQIMPNVQDKETGSRVSQWVKNTTKSQFAHPCYFPSCPPKIPSSFLTYVSPHLAHRQVGTDHLLEKDRHPTNSTSQSNGSHSLLGEGLSQSSDINDSWKSPPAKVRKLNRHSECNAESMSATMNCQEPDFVPSMNKCSFYYSGKCRLETSSSRNDNDQSLCGEGLGNSFSKDAHFSPDVHNNAVDRTNTSNKGKHQELNKSSRSQISECKSTHFLSMNEEEFDQRVSSLIVRNIKKYLNLDSFRGPINRNNNDENTRRHGSLRNSGLNQPAAGDFEPQKFMFPEEYINMFSPSNPNRIDSDEAVRIEQEVASSALDFKQCLRSFRPRRHQKRNSHPILPIQNKTRDMTGDKTMTRSPPKDPAFSDDILSGYRCVPEIVTETFQFKKPLDTLSKRKHYIAACTEKKFPKEMTKRDFSVLKPSKPAPNFRSSTPKPFQTMPDTDCPNSSISTIVTPSICGPLETEDVEPISLNGSSDAFEEEDEDRDISLIE